MKVAGIAAAVLVGMMANGGAQASDLKYDGNELLAQCQQYLKVADSERNYDVLAVGICGGFIGGVNSTVFFYSDVLKKDVKYCMPDSVTNGQMVRIVVKYLKDNPKRLNEGRTELVWNAFMDAYPCK
ncbi:Rap1a/Tai family immunity protein [Pseudomonas sp. O230]|uniref:Rap1a/Tai family immunity protein n=1 Tax=Pseudomonas sp. O230 TaxID=3159450 RepID=UPI00387B2BD0